MFLQKSSRFWKILEKWGNCFQSQVLYCSSMGKYDGWLSWIAVINANSLSHKHTAFATGSEFWAHSRSLYHRLKYKFIFLQKDFLEIS